MEHEEMIERGSLFDAGRCVAILSALPDLIFRIDRSGRFIDYNGASDDLYVEPDGFLGSLIEDVFPADLAKTFRNALETSFRSHGAQIINYDLRFDRKKKFFEARVLHYDNNEAIVIVRNVTEYKEMESELLESNMRLSDALVELKRTQEHVIHHERLAALGEMASGVAHDFNNVLMPIMGYADFLIQNPDTLDDRDEALEMIGIIKTAAINAREAVRRLQHFYRPASDAEMDVVGVGNLLKDVSALTSLKWKEEMQAKDVGIDLKLNVQENLSVKGHEADLQEMLTNLVFNSVDAMPEGGEIIISACSIGRGKNIEIRVTDTGVGMSDDVRRKCIEPFFTTKIGHGAGLGMAMVHGIVRRHRGILEVDSIPGEGTSVTVYLPAACDSIHHGDAIVAKEASLNPMRILCVDDSKNSRDLVKRLLSEDGHIVELAEDGAEGMSKVEEMDLDLVITDRAMPRMSGDKFAKIIKEKYPDMPVIMLTGFGDLMQEEASAHEFIDMILAKPVSQRQLRNAVSEVIGRSDK